MSQTRSDVVLVKLGAVFIIVYALQNVAYYATYIFGGFDYIRISILVFVLVALVPWLIAIALWKFPQTVVGSLYSTDSNVQTSSSDSDKFLLLGVSLIGVYTLTFGIIDLAYFEALRYSGQELAAEAGFPDNPVPPETVAGRYTNILQIIFGVTLVAGRRTIANFLRRVCRAGTEAS